MITFTEKAIEKVNEFAAQMEDAAPRLSRELVFHSKQYRIVEELGEAVKFAPHPALGLAPDPVKIVLRTPAFAAADRRRRWNPEHRNPVRPGVELAVQHCLVSIDDRGDLLGRFIDQFNPEVANPCIQKAIQQ